METISIELSQEVYRSDAEKMINWLSDKEIISNLNEDSNVTRNLINMINRIDMPILTHLFNNNCSFFTIKNIDQTVGSLRLIPKSKGMEIVIAVGEKELWGRGIGYNAVLEALKKAFFDLRTDKVVAKVKKANKRSRNLFKGIGFKEVKESEKEVEYQMTKDIFWKIAS